MKPTWEQVVRFHGHVCPGLALGYRAAGEALDALEVDAAYDEELVAIVENDACGVDAVQMMTGCTLGKGNLIYRDYGKPVYILCDRKTGAAVRVVMGSPGRDDIESAHSLGERIRSGLATEGERMEHEALRRQYVELILNAQPSEFLKVTAVQLEMPDKARIFAPVQCSRCGEMVMEARARIRDGEPVCIPCSAHYSRGW